MNAPTHHAASILLSTLALALAGCSSAAGGAKAGGGAPATGADGGTLPPNGGSSDGCPQIAACAQSCAGATCVTGCISAGSTESQAKYQAILDCAQTNMCADTPCIQAKCSAQLDACASDTAPSGGAGDAGTALEGSIPTNLVGTWTHDGFSGPDQFVFGADGTGSYYNGLDLTNACPGSIQFIVQTGPTVFTATSFIIHATQAQTTTLICGVHSQTPTQTEDFTGTYVYDGSMDTLSITYASTGGTITFQRTK